MIAIGFTNGVCGNAVMIIAGREWAQPIFCQKRLSLSTIAMTTDRSGSHRRFERVLDKMGIAYDSEHNFPPYCVDIYLQEWHAYIEVDGPVHGLRRKRDEARDEYLRSRYCLLSLRLASDLAVGLIRLQVLEFIALAASTAVERRHQMYLVEAG